MLPIMKLDSCSVPSDQLEGFSKGLSMIKSRLYSQQSILCAMERFVKSVQNMDATVLVPSKLRDMETAAGATPPTSARVPSALANADLHTFYLMLSNVKKELLWGPGTLPTSHPFVVHTEGSGTCPSPVTLKHSGQCSDDSLGSLGSTASSTSDTDSEADSMMTDRDSVQDHTSHLSLAFRHHLQGLHSILHQLADSADYLSTRYQEEVDASL